MYTRVASPEMGVFGLDGSLGRDQTLEPEPRPYRVCWVNLSSERPAADVKACQVEHWIVKQAADDQGMWLRAP